jgi:hypothetical protein
MFFFGKWREARANFTFQLAPPDEFSARNNYLKTDLGKDELTLSSLELKRKYTSKSLLNQD